LLGRFGGGGESEGSGESEGCESDH
jgi:hypothetical protein